MTSRAERSTKPQFVLDNDETDDHDEDSEVDQRGCRLPRIVVDGAGTERRRRESQEEEQEERHVGFVDDALNAKEERDLERGLPREEPTKESHTYPPNSKNSLDRPSPTVSNRDSTDSNPSSKTATSTKKWTDKLRGHSPSIPESLAWVPSKLNWKGLRPVVRATIASWCGLVFMLAHPSQVALGRAGFLVLVVSVISPAALPIANQLEQTFFQFLLVSISWAWATLALAIAHAARTRYHWTQAEFTTFASQPYLNSGYSAAEISDLVTNDLYHGRYLEPASSAVCGVFLGVAAGFFLWLRGYLGPSPALFGCIFAIILQVISLTLGVLFPYPYYTIGLTFFIPFACQHAITIACTILIFPETLAHQFSDRTIATLSPLRQVIQRQSKMLKSNPRTAEWLEYAEIKATTTQAMASLALMNTAESNLTREISFARVNGKDLTSVLQKMRVLTARTTGFVRFYEVVSKHLHRDYTDAKGGPVADDLTIHLGRSGAPSTVASPNDTPETSRPPSPTRTPTRQDSKDAANSTALAEALDNEKKKQQSTRRGSHPDSVRGSPLSPPSPRKTPSYRRTRSNPLAGNNSDSQHSHSSLELNREKTIQSLRDSKPRSRSRHRNRERASHVSLSSLLHDVLHPHVDVKPVGLVASMRYADLEDILSNPRDEEHIEEIVRLLSTTSEELLSVNDEAVGHLIETIHRIKATENTWSYLFHPDDSLVDEQIKTSEAQLEQLKAALGRYRDEKRLDVIRPFAKLFDPYGSGLEPPDPLEGGENFQTPSHRGLFWAFSYQSSLLSWSEALVDVYESVLRIEKKRRRPRIWFPDWSKARFDKTSAQEGVDDEDPDSVGDLDIHSFSAGRHPDYRPPKTAFQLLGVRLANFGERITRRDVLFGLKAAVLMGICTMPAYFPSTSFFFQRERGVWVIIMIALTTTQFVGDTVFGFILRVFGTLGGAIYGLLIWSIAAQKGKGNPYAMGVACAFGLFPILFWRVHVMPPMKGILPAITSVLIIGYSWQNGHNPAPSSIGWGWPIAWRRFVCVLIGISIAFVWTYVPPVTTQKISIRRTYSRVIDRLGACFAQIVSFANVKHGPSKPPKAIVKNIGTLRARLAKTTQAASMTRYELSLQGPWPAEHYTALQALQMEILDLYGDLCGVISSLDDKWTAALLHRSQLSNPYFLQDLFTTFQLLSSALYHGSPLPMVYNPLLERFLNPPEVHEAGRPYAYEVVLGDDEIEGLPHHVTLDVICSIEYMKFSTGCSAVYAIVNRLDRLMFVTKSLVGEAYLLYGLDLANTHQLHGGEDRHFGISASRRTSVDHSPV
ncbi:hypothetical protein JCM16303_006623 [Sporobolomyces ruberrimus]